MPTRPRHSGPPVARPAGTKLEIKQKMAAWAQYQARFMRDRILPEHAKRD